MTATRRTVLVVDDEPAVSGLIRLLLMGAGYNVVEAHSHTGAIDALRTTVPPIDLVLADVELRDQGCYTIARHVQLEAPGTRVLCMSALPGNAWASVTRFAADVVPKPLDAVALVRRIQETLAADPH